MKTLSAPVWVAKTKSIEFFVTDCVDKQVNKASTAAWYGPHNLTDLERCLAGCPLDSYRQIKQDFFLVQQTKQRQTLMIGPNSSAQICICSQPRQEATSNCTFKLVSITHFASKNKAFTLVPSLRQAFLMHRSYLCISMHRLVLHVLELVKVHFDQKVGKWTINTWFW